MANDDSLKHWDMWKDDNDKSAMDLRWSGHVLLAHMHVLRQQCKDTLEGLEGRDDREARGLLEGLVKEFRTANESQATLLGRMSKSNQVLMDMLQKNEDGQASVAMGRAIDTLVKALSKAEEEVQSLKVNLKEVEGQRDKYKRYLEKTNADLELPPAYAQLSRAMDQNAFTQTPAKRHAPDEDDSSINTDITASACDKPTLTKDTKNARGISGKASSTATTSRSKRPTPTGRNVRGEASARTLRSARREQKKNNVDNTILEEALSGEARSNVGEEDSGNGDGAHGGINKNTNESDGGDSGMGNTSHKDIVESISDSDDAPSMFF